MTISELFNRAGIQPDLRNGDAEFTRLECDSRLVEQGALFMPAPSLTDDSDRFIANATANGAAGIIAHSEDGYEIARHTGAAALLRGERKELIGLHSRLARAAYRDPDNGMEVFAVTGTNGKTSVAWMIAEVLDGAYLGTLGFRAGTIKEELPNTTPQPVEFWKRVARARDEGCRSIALEASSHALDEGRILGLEVDVAVLTNITPEHMDYHADMEEYADAKLKLFTGYARAAAINASDPICERWRDRIRIPITTYHALDSRVQAASSIVQMDRIELELIIDGEPIPKIELPVGGWFNAFNAEAAIAALVASGREPAEFAPKLGAMRPVPGRFEPVSNDRGLSIVIDYAHTPDAFESLLQSVESMVEGRIIVLFGCGGDRDATKRPRMGRVASDYAVAVVLTTDNPRSENPAQIAEQVRAGMTGKAVCYVVLDRGLAIAKAIELAQPGDAVLLVGKGHENYQIVNGVKHHSDDRELARAALSGVVA